MKRTIFRGTFTYMLVCLLAFSPSITFAHTEVKERGFFASIYCKVISVVGMECDELEEDTHDDHADENPAPSNTQTNSVVPNRNENRITATSTQTTQSQTPTQTPRTSTAQPTIIERITTPVTTIVQGITLDYFNNRIQELKEELALSSSNRSVSRNTFSKQTDNIHEDFTEADQTLETSLLEVISTATTTLSSNSFNQNGNAFGTTATLGTTDSNPLSLITNNTSRLFISEDGNVGVGTSTSSDKFHVNGGKFQWSDGDSNIRFTTPLGNTGIIFNQYETGSYSRFNMRNEATADSTNREFSLYYEDDGYGSGLNIKYGGNIGIGTTTPTSKLTIDGLPDTNNYNSLQIMGNAGNGHYISLIRGSAPTQGLLIGRGTIAANTPHTGASFIRSAGGVDEALHLQSGKDLSSVYGSLLLNLYGGLVGVGPGAQTPLALLHVASTTPSVDLFRVDGSAGNTFIYTQGGNVGIGTTTPGAVAPVSPFSSTDSRYLTVNPNALTDTVFQLQNSDTTYGLDLWHDGSTGDVYFDARRNNSIQGAIFFRNRTSGTPMNTMTLLNGNVGVGTTTPDKSLTIKNPSYNSYLRVGTGMTVNAGVGIGLSAYNSTTPNFVLEVSNGGYFNVTDGTRVLSFGNVGGLGLLRSDRIAVTDYGTAALPSIALDNTTSDETGFYRPALNNMGFVTDRLERMRIDEDGNVGIGTSTPSYKLTVEGDTNQTGKTYINGTQILHYPGGDFSRTVYVGNGGNNLSRVVSNDGDYNTAVGIDALLANTTGSFNVAVGNRALYANTTGNENVSIGRSALTTNTTGNENIGIGNSALTANTMGEHNIGIGGSSLNTNSTGNSNIAIGYRSLYRNVAGSNNTALGYTAGFDIDTSLGTGANTIIGYNTGRGITTGVNNTIIGANVTGLSSTLSNNIILSDGSGNRRINVDSSGNVGIGTTAPEYKMNVQTVKNTLGLVVQAVADQSGDWTGVGVGYPGIVRSALIWERNQVDATFSKLHLAVSASGSPTPANARLTIVDNGNVGIGNTSPQRRLHVTTSADEAPVRFEDSSGYCEINPTSTTWTCTSDKRLKTNIQDLNSSSSSLSNSSTLERLSKLRPVTFEWKTDNTHTERIGFIAQEVEEIFPDLVMTDADTGFKSVAYGSFTVYIIDAIRELAGQVKEMAQSIAGFSKFFESDTVKTKELCVGSKCISEEDFIELLEDRDISGHDARGNGSGESGETNESEEEGGEDAEEVDENELTDESNEGNEDNDDAENMETDEDSVDDDSEEDDTTDPTRDETSEDDVTEDGSDDGDESSADNASDDTPNTQ